MSARRRDRRSRDGDASRYWLTAESDQVPVKWFKRITKSVPVIRTLFICSHYRRQHRSD